ncbi:MAG: TlpA family protein disulfide reductase [bacterium]|nr:MAG: TlpA family protein disulfide reductase [bacterium]
MFKIQFLCVFVLIILGCVNSSGQEPQPDERGYIVKVGDKIDDFEVILLAGSSQKISEFKQPIIVLNFFASWCVVCRKEIPHIEKEVWQQFKDHGLIVLGVDYKEKPDTVQKFVDEMKISYPVALDENGEIFNRFARGGVTRNIVLDGNLNIIYLTRLFDLNEFEGMKNIIRQKLGSKPDSLKSIKKEEREMEQFFLRDMANTDKKILLQYQGKHKVHLEGRIKKKKWRKLEIEVSLFKEDIVSSKYDKKTNTLRIGYQHYDGIRIAILPMTPFKVPISIEQVVIYDVE